MQGFHDHLERSESSWPIESPEGLGGEPRGRGGVSGGHAGKAKRRLIVRARGEVQGPLGFEDLGRRKRSRALYGLSTGSLGSV